MANLWTTYKFSINGVLGFQTGAGLNYRDKTYSDTTNLNSAPAFVVRNLSLSYEETHWGVALNVKNFTNERYFVAANGAGAYQDEGLVRSSTCIIANNPETTRPSPWELTKVVA